jgi:hypothetical protein
VGRIEAAVVRIGSYRGAPAFEYELREDGTLLAADFVVLHPLEGETYDDLVAFVSAYLAERVREWGAVRDRRSLAELRTGARIPARADAAPVKVADGLPAERHLVASIEALTEAEAGVVDGGR